VDNETYLEFHWSMKNRLNIISQKLFNISHTFLFTVSSAQSRYLRGYCLVELNTGGVFLTGLEIVLSSTAFITVYYGVEQIKWWEKDSV